jgi:hypothetical protein
VSFKFIIAVESNLLYLFGAGIKLWLVETNLDYNLFSSLSWLENHLKFLDPAVIVEKIDSYILEKDLGSFKKLTWLDNTFF